MGFANQGVIVTGGGSGIGLAAARELKARGAHVMLWDRDAAALESAARSLNTACMEIDVTRSADVQAAMHEAANTLDGLHTVIHAAGILRTGIFDTLDIEAQRQMIEVNVGGTITVAHAALPYLKKTRGSLILLSSVSGFYGAPEFAAYSATKAAVLNFAQALRTELAAAGVHIGVVAPLFVNSPMLQSNQSAALVSSKSPLNHIYTPEQVAQAIIRGLEARRFMIFPGVRPRLIYLLSRYFAFLSHSLMSSSWRRSS
jgi:short-subunit dehydrogenase